MGLETRGLSVKSVNNERCQFALESTLFLLIVAKQSRGPFMIASQSYRWSIADQSS